MEQAARRRISARLARRAPTAVAQVDRTPVPAEVGSGPPVYAGSGARGCLICHGPNAARSGAAILEGPHAVLGNPRAPLATAHQCEACRGPSQAHLTVLPGGTRPPPAIAFSAAETAEHKDAPCLGCHQREAGVHWASSVHRFEQVACTDCHSAHVRQDPVLTAAGATVRLSNEHERYRTRDFAFDAVEPGTIPNVVSLGHSSPSYSVNWVMLTYGTRF